jgi:SprT protein
MNTSFSQSSKSLDPAFSIEPIGLTKQQQVVVQTEHFIRLGGELLGREFDYIPVYFDLKGRTAGMYKVAGRGRRIQRQIRYNPWIFAKYYENNLTVTVPHEVAHYLVDCVHGLRKVRPHGNEWKAVMNAFGVDSRATSTFDLEGIPTRRQQQVDYRCGCKEHQLGIRRHNKVSRGEANYLCRYCGEVLRFVEPDNTL